MLDSPTVNHIFLAFFKVYTLHWLYRCYMYTGTICIQVLYVNVSIGWIVVWFPCRRRGPVMTFERMLGLLAALRSQTSGRCCFRSALRSLGANFDAAHGNIKSSVTILRQLPWPVPASVMTPSALGRRSSRILWRTLSVISGVELDPRHHRLMFYPT